MRNHPISVEPLTPVIGAEVHGVDLSQPLDDPTFDAVHQALLSHQVIFFRDQDLDLDQLERLGNRFGPPHIHPTIKCIEGHPGVTRIHVDADSKIYDGRKWHSDVTCDPEPPMGSILHLNEGTGEWWGYFVLVHVRGLPGALRAHENLAVRASSDARIRAQSGCLFWRKGARFA